MEIQRNINHPAMGLNEPAQRTLKPFPKHWGAPPPIQTCDWTELPDGFGFGSSTLKFWILDHLKIDSTSNSPEANQIGTTSFGILKPFPKHWGSPPQIQTKDMIELPNGFGIGSSTLKFWILENIQRDIKS